MRDPSASFGRKLQPAACRHVKARAIDDRECRRRPCGKVRGPETRCRIVSFDEE